MSALSPGGPALLSGFAMTIRGQDQRQTPVAAQKQRRATRLRAIPIAGDWLDRMRLISDERFTGVGISIVLPGEAMKWKVKFAAATRRSFCSRHQKGNGTVRPYDVALARSRPEGLGENLLDRSLPCIPGH